MMLPLSMSIRVDHHEACLERRIAQITDHFQAKLGWLRGQQFSRVGTPDGSPETRPSPVVSPAPESSRLVIVVGRAGLEPATDRL